MSRYNPFPKNKKEEQRILLELAHKEGKRRFGSPCKHEQTKNGRCVKCLRKVVTKLGG